MSVQQPSFAVQDRISIEFSTPGEADAVFRGRIGFLSQENLWARVSAEVARPKPATIEVGHQVHLVIQTANRLWDAASRFVNERRRPDGGVWFIVVRPTTAQLIQRRRSVRVEVPATIHLRAPSQSAESGEINARLRNLSAGGVQVATDAGLDIGAQVEVVLTAQPNVSIVLKAAVIRIEQPQWGPAGPRFIALRFLEMTERDEDKIVRLLFETQRRRLARQAAR